MGLPWKGLGLERVLVIVGKKATLFTQGLAENSSADVDKAVRVAFHGDEQTIDLALLARTLLPTLSAYGPVDLFSHYSINDKTESEALFSLFSCLVDDYMKLPPDLLTLLSELLPSPNSDLVRRLIRFGMPQQVTQPGERVRPTSPPKFSLSEVLAPDGVLARNLPGYEARSGQKEMAQRVLDALEHGKTATVEAGPGTGKTFAYLVPALIHLREHDGARVVISTRTKQLQEQVFYKDIPFLASRLLPSVQVALLKGRSNYVCLRRWQIALGELVEGLEQDLLSVLAPVARWLFSTQTGDIEENNAFLAEREAKGLWRRICDDPHRCIGQSCPLYDDCFSVAARRRARGADLVVVNHSLLLADQLSEQAILGEYESLIVDEAHALESAARHAFTISISVHNVDSFLRAIEHPLGRHTGGWLARLPFVRTDARIKKMHDLVGTLRGANSRLFLAVSQGLAPGRGRSPDLVEFADQVAEVMRELETLTRSIESLGDAADSQELEHEANGLIAEGEGIVAAFARMSSPPDENSVHWYEFINGEPYLHLSPLSVVPFLEESLYPRIESLVLTSATLSQGGDFAYLEESLGLSAAPGKSESTVVPSPFSYEDAMKILVPEFLPPVTARDGSYATALADCVKRIAHTAGRKILILFTSYRLLHALRDEIDDDIDVFAQGIDGPRSKLIERFKQSKGPVVLLGTDSFWEGVDLPGDALEILIITRLPFPVPTDPVFSALADRMANAGSDPFSGLSIPRAILKLRQGVGRLIRTTTDHGVVIIADDRIIRKGYGKRFVASLPVPAQKCVSVDDLLAQVAAWLRPAE